MSVLDLFVYLYFLFSGLCIGVWSNMEIKKRPKKPLVKKECFSRAKNGKQDFVIMYFCPNCTEKLRADFKYCYECGQKLDWSEV